MTGQDQTNTLERLWEEVPVGPAPLDDIIRGGRAATRRRRVAGLSGGLAVLLLGVVAGYQVPDHGPGSGERESDLVGAASSVDLPTSSWEPGDYSMTALGTGRLAVDHRGCVYLTPAEGINLGGRPGPGDRGLQRSYWVWPAGYTATVTEDGRLTLYDASRSVAGHDGDQVEAGGGYTSVTAQHVHSCLPKAGGDEVFFVQSTVRVDS